MGSLCPQREGCVPSYEHLFHLVLGRNIDDIVWFEEQRHDKWGEKHSVRSPNVLWNWVQQVKTRQFDSQVNLTELGVRNRHVGDKSDILNGRHGGTRGCGRISKRAFSLLVDHLLYEHIGPMLTAADLQCAGNKSLFFLVEPSDLRGHGRQSSWGVSPHG